VPGIGSAIREVAPPFAATFSAELNDPEFAAACADIALPPELQAAVPKRRAQFRAGRRCARMALRALLPLQPDVELVRGDGGAPIWPLGVTGSITHTDTVAAAVVARSADAASIGIDVEPIMSLARSRDVARVVAWPSEVAVARLPGFDRNGALTLVFSAKESLFKCLYPLVGSRFGFHDVRVVSVDGRTGTFDVRLVKGLSAQWRAGMMVQGRFALAADDVHTGVCVAAPVEHDGRGEVPAAALGAARW
jgi:enterobactin synthetase component D